VEENDQSVTSDSARHVHVTLIMHVFLSVAKSNGSGKN